MNGIARHCHPHPAHHEFDRVRADLLVEFQTGEIPLEKCCEKYFGVQIVTAKNMATNNKLPVPAHRIASRKSPWLIRVDDLAHLIIQRRLEANEVWSMNQGIAV